MSLPCFKVSCKSETYWGTPLQSLGLAVRAFGALQGKCAEQAEVSHSVLVLAGGFDKRLAENREHFCELQELVQQLGLQDKVRSQYYLDGSNSGCLCCSFTKSSPFPLCHLLGTSIVPQVRLVASFSDAQRSALLAVACAVLYTPENEHFGIVPLEAMAAGRPVVACDSGGPKETVVNGITGHLCPPQATAFAAAMARLAVRALDYPKFHRCTFLPVTATYCGHASYRSVRADGCRILTPQQKWANRLACMCRKRSHVLLLGTSLMVSFRG